MRRTVGPRRNRLRAKRRGVSACVALLLCLVGEAFGQRPELVTEEGHTSVVRAVAFSPDGRIVASGSEDKKIKLFDVDARMELRSMAGNGGDITSLVFADNRTLVSADDYGNVRLWDTATGRETRTLERLGCGRGRGCVTSLALSEDRQTLAVAGKGRAVTFWQVSSWRPAARSLPAPEVYIHGFAYSSRAGLLATAGQDGVVVVWSVADGGKRTIHESDKESAVTCVAFSPDGAHLIGGGLDNALRVWSVASGEVVNSWAAHEGGVNSVAYGRDAGVVVSGGNDSAVRVWTGHAGVEALPALKHKLKVRAVAASPAASLIAGGGNDSAVTLWDARDGRELRKWGPHTFFVKDLAFSPDGGLLATAHAQTVKLWNAATGRELRTFKRLEGWIFALAFSPDGSRLAGGSGGQNLPYELTVWDVATGRVVFSVRDTVAYSVAFSCDGKLLAEANHYGSINLRDASDGRLLRPWRFSPPGETKALVFDAANQLISGSADGRLRVWDVNNAEPVRTVAAGIGGLTAVDLSNDPPLLAARGHSSVKVWDLRTWQESPVVIPATVYEGGVRFSPDARLLATGNYYLSEAGKTVAVVQLVETSTGSVVHNMPGHENGVTSVAFSRDGKRVLSGSWDNTFRMWDAESGRHLCTVIALDEEDWVAITPEGRFDASDKGMELMHWRVGDELIAFTQLKKAFWEPGLLAKLLGLNREGFITDVDAFREVRLFPKVEYEPPAPGSTRLTLRLTSRGGGIGRVEVKVNNAEVAEDARGPGFDASRRAATLTLDLARAPLVAGRPNTIQVVAWNADGYLSGRRETREWVPAGEEDKTPPEFYAVVVGVSDYAEPSIRLKYSAEDAEAFAAALELGARNLFPGEGRAPNEGRVHIQLLRTSKDPQAVPPKKENIRKAFEAMKSARPQDVVVVYFSGHGIALQNRDALRDGLYCFLAQEARSKSPADYANPALVEQRAVTSRELASWIAPVRALRRVMILDTCAAGAAARDFTEKGDDLTAYQLRAIDRLNDRTGFFILMGSAADSVSYEATQYEQSLLTYSLLRRMKTETDAPERIEVAALFQHAADEVHQLALGTSGIQKPEIRIPEGGASFPIGLLTNEDKRNIRAKIARPVVLRPSFLNGVAQEDDLRLSAELRKRLDEMTYARARGAAFQSEIVYFDAEGYRGGYLPTGIYTVEGDRVKVGVVLTRDGERIRFEVVGQTGDLQALVSRIIDAIIERVEPPKD